MISLEQLKKLLTYDPLTGDFIRLVSTSQNAVKGSVAGGLNWAGYVLIRVEGKQRRAHKLAWFYMTGEWPLFQIDHKDSDRANNAWGNLRKATSRQNAQNRPISPKNLSGFKGVSWDPANRNWVVRCRHEGKNKYLGRRSSPEEASEVYQAFAKSIHGEFYNEQVTRKCNESSS